MSKSVPSSCIRCGARRLSCDRNTPCQTCLVAGHGNSCSYDWTLGPHIFKLWHPSANLSAKIRIDMQGYQPAPNGAFGCIYRAQPQGMRPVAVKVLFRNRWLAPRALELSVREAWLWSTLYHANIAPFLGVADYAEICPGAFPQLCLVSPWMSSGNVMDYLWADPDADRLALACDIARGMVYLHAQRVAGTPIIHGDIRGSNVLIDIRGRPVACITDFGLSQLDEIWAKAETTSTSHMGNVRWLAYERLFPSKYGIKHHPLAKTAASDVFEAMRTILELFTGNVPFHEWPEYDVMRALTEERLPERPNSEWVDEDMWKIMRHSWSSQRTNRPASKDLLRIIAQKLFQRWVHVSSYISLSGVQQIVNDLHGIPVPTSIIRDGLVYTRLQVPSLQVIELRHRVDVPFEDDFALVFMLAEGLPMSTWKHLRLVASASNDIASWLSFLPAQCPTWVLETLEIVVEGEDQSGGYLDNLLSILEKTRTTLKNLRLRQKMKAQPPANAFSYSRPAILEGLECLELQNMHKNDASAVMWLCSASRLRCLVLDQISGHWLDDSLSFEGIANFERAWTGLKELILIHYERIDLQKELRKVFGYLKDLEVLHLEDPYRRSGTSLAFLSPADARLRPLPRLKTLRIGGYRPEKVLDAIHGRFMSGQRIQRLMLKWQDIGMPSDALASTSEWRAAREGDDLNRMRIASAVGQIGWFDYTDRSSREMGSQLEEGLFWSEAESPDRDTIPLPRDSFETRNGRAWWAVTALPRR